LSTTDSSGNPDNGGLDTAAEWLGTSGKNHLADVNIIVAVDFGSPDGTARFTNISNGKQQQTICADGQRGWGMEV
jgi:hypothetical protein